MATKKHIIKGKAMWAKVFHENMETRDYQGNPYPCEGMYKIDVILDKENKAIYKASGTAGKGKFDDDGNFIVTLKRKHKDKFDWAGDPPSVLGPTNYKWDFSTDGVIPNGSEVEVVFSVYTTSMTPGTRLEEVRVLEIADMPDREAVSTKKEEASVEVPF